MADYLRERVSAAVDGHYTIESEIGRGGMSAVYRARDQRLHRDVAIKVLTPELAFNPDVRARFMREAQTAARLAHPHIVPIYAVDELEGLVYFVMALVDGESAGDLLTREPSWTAERVSRVLRDVADALAYAHAHGVIHRDIKPDNILIDRATGKAIVTDFGIARAALADTRLTATGAAMGTPAYMSPEQALGEADIDGRSDIYSLGVVGYRMLAGDTPFKAANTPAMLVKHVSERPRPIREVRPDAPAYLAVAIDRAMAKRPADRWRDAAELRDALDKAAVPTDYAPAGIAEPSWQPHTQLPSTLAQPPVMLPPPGLSRKELRRWAKLQARLAKAEALRDAVGTPRVIVGASSNGVPLAVDLGALRYDSRPLDHRVIAFRRSVIALAVLGPILFLVNVASRGFPWFFIPTGFMLLDVVRKGASIWSDGIGPIDAFKKGIRKRIRSMSESDAPETVAHAPVLPARPLAPRPAPPVDPASKLAASDVLAGPHGPVVRRAANDRATIRDTVASLSDIERDMIPDVSHTVDALAERVAQLATTLHHLDSDVSGSSLGALDSRIAGLKTETATPDRDRRLSLLERQRGSLRDLLDRRQALANQLESAALMLQNLKLDLLKLRSSGVGSSIEDVTSATQEARALSQDIGHIIEASDDLRKLQR